MSKLKRMLAVLLTMATLLTMLPMSALATDAELGLEEEIAVEVPAEEPELPAEEPELPAEEPAEEPELPAEEPAEEPELPAEEPAEEPELPAEEPAEEPGLPAEEPVEEPEPPTEEPAGEPELPAEEPEAGMMPTAELPEEEPIEDTFYQVNPLYARYASNDQAAACADADEIVVDAGTLDSAASASKTIRNYMKSRTTSFSFTYTDSAYDWDRIGKIVNDAMAHTGIPTEGDYLMWQWKRWGCSRSVTSSSSGYSIYLSFTFEYYTTASEERAVDSAVSNLRKSLGLSGKTQYEKVKRVYDWMCDNISYDYEHLSWGQDYPHQFTAYGAIVDRTCVCQGYAVLFYRMALEEKVDARVITGYGSTWEDPNAAHAWNIVKLDGRYYNLDATWDAGQSSYSYFLKCPSSFDGDHIRNHGEYDSSTGNYMPNYTSSDFQTKYPMGTKNYALPATPKLVSAENTAQGVTVKWGAVSGAKKYRVYCSSDGGKTWPAYKDTTDTYYHFPNLASGRTYNFTVRAYTTSANSSVRKPGISVLRLNIPQITIKNAANGIQVEWDQIPGAKGYYVYRKLSGGNYSLIATIKSGSTVSYFDTAVKDKNGTTYGYAVRAYSGSTRGYFKGVVAVRLTTLSIASLSNSGKGQVTVKWSRNSAATGYRVYYTTGGTTKSVVVKGNTKLSTVITGLSKGKTYTIQVRSYKTVNGKNYYSGYCGRKTIKINK